MNTKLTQEQLDQLDRAIEHIMRPARIPGIALAVICHNETVLAKGYGYRSLSDQLPVTADTRYPIASTTKALNATLLGTLVDEGQVSWDAPVQRYLPWFRLGDSSLSAQVSIRDLVSMRTGLPRHDWVWMEHSISRRELAENLRYLELSSGFRQRFQYNNLTTATAGFIAEVVTGDTWENLVQKRILTPLRMSSTQFSVPDHDNVTVSYHENNDRKLIPTQRHSADVLAPSGTSTWSTVKDMASWMSCNLTGGQTQRHQIINPATLAEIHAPQLSARTDPSSPTPEAAYAMGWFVDTYNGHARLAHGGYHHDVHSNVMLFPQTGLGFVCFTNFGCPRLADLINQTAFDIVLGLESAQTVGELLRKYECKIDENRRRISGTHRVNRTTPSHDLHEYVGAYVHPAYGPLEIRQSTDGTLTLHRVHLIFPLKHWHYDTWVAQDCELFPIHAPHPFDGSGRVQFLTDVDGQISSLRVSLEPNVAPIHFQKNPPLNFTQSDQIVQSSRDEAPFARTDFTGASR